jgi:hypothetical protein
MLGIRGRLARGTHHDCGAVRGVGGVAGRRLRSRRHLNMLQRRGKLPSGRESPVLRMMLGRPERTVVEEILSLPRG